MLHIYIQKKTRDAFYILYSNLYFQYVTQMSDMLLVEIFFLIIIAKNNIIFVISVKVNAWNDFLNFSILHIKLNTVSARRHQD